MYTHTPPTLREHDRALCHGRLPEQLPTSCLSDTWYCRYVSATPSMHPTFCVYKLHFGVCVCVCVCAGKKRENINLTVCENGTSMTQYRI